MKPDVVVVWPRGCDYPLWREFIREEREHFERVVVVFTASGARSRDYRQFARPLLEACDVTVLDACQLGGEWRNTATNLALDELRDSPAEWVWFTEQDFRITNPHHFWNCVAHGENHRQIGLIGIYEETRWHPCCLFVRKSLIEETACWFGTGLEPGQDHFWQFGQEIEFISTAGDLWGFAHQSFSHMAGLSHNHELLDRDGPPAVTYKPGEFSEYLTEALEAKVPLDPNWRGVAEGFVQWYASAHD